MGECNQYEELLSAAVDGELVEDELSLLESHLAGCHECRKTIDRFSEINSLSKTIGYQQSAPRLTTVPSMTKPPAKSTAVRGARQGLKWWQIASALAAALMIGLTTSLWLRSDASSAVSLEEPIATLDVIYEKTMKDNKAKLKTLQLQLRALRLEATSANLNEEESLRFNDKIQTLMEKVRLAGL